MFRTLLAATALTGLMMIPSVLAQDQTQGPTETQNQQNAQNQEGQLDIQSVQTSPMAGGVGAGQQVTVNSGDTIVIQPTNEGGFTLHFQFGQAGVGTPMQGVGAAAQPTDQTTAGVQQPVQRDQLQQADPEQMSVDNLMGSTVYGANDESIGNVGDVLLTEDGSVDALVVDVGGFLGIGVRQVALGVDNLQFLVDEFGGWYVYTPFTQEQLEQQPEYNADSYSEDRDNQRLTAEAQ